MRRPKKGGWDVRVFDRRRSVLIVYRFWRTQWGLCVADSDACEIDIGTREEMEFVLRAFAPRPARYGSAGNSDPARSRRGWR